MTGDRLIGAGTAAVVAAVAAFAAIVSYSHIYDLGEAARAGTAARLLPLSVDGLILAASLVMPHEARNGRPAPLLARYMLGLGVAATVAANVAYGSAFGVLGALISAWPAVAFIGSVEMAMGLVRATRSTPEAAHSAPADLPAVAADAESAARAVASSARSRRKPLSRSQPPAMITAGSMSSSTASQSARRG